MLAGIQDKAEKKNYKLLFCHSNEDYEREVRSVETLLDARVCGILASQSKSTRKFDHFQEIIDNKVHLVFFDRICTGINTDKVVVDDYAGAFNAVEYLISTGCKRIAFLGPRGCPSPTTAGWGTKMRFENTDCPSRKS